MDGRGNTMMDTAPMSDYIMMGSGSHTYHGTANIYAGGTAWLSTGSYSPGLGYAPIPPVAQVYCCEWCGSRFTNSDLRELNNCSRCGAPIPRCFLVG